jgi:dTDP-4-amino-4,6-dideoxygalactose transaminase
MEEERLAILGGSKAISRKLKKYNSIGLEELEAAKRVVDSGVLSKFLGSNESDFFGGPKVRGFEKACEEYFEVKHAVTVNSWTSGLICAVGAIGIEPGDEVIVTPWTMCASATAILHWNAIPVFADIEEDTFNIDPKSVEENITQYTKAIMAVDIFGHSCDIDALMEIAERYNLKVITDSAQAPGVKNKGRFTGTLAHVGGFSLNYHKHIHTGEGGILVTNDEQIFKRLQLIRNHAEAVVEDGSASNLSNMVGHNFRLGEIESAIGIEQLKKLDNIIKRRQRAAERLSRGLQELDGLRTPITKESCTHAYYMFPMILDIDKIGLPRNTIYEALVAEGVYGLTQGYANIHQLPMYQKKIAYGSKGFPWSSEICKRDVVYDKGICPIAENLHDKSYFGYEMCLHELDDDDVDLIVSAFRKVWNQLSTLSSV